jgi:hypothetical protein
MKNIPYSISNDFLKDAQWLEPLLIEINEKPIIENLDHKFCSFGSCFAQNLQSFMLPFGFHFYFERQICAYYQVKAMENLFLRLLEEEDYSDDRIYEFSKTDHMAYEYFRLRHYGRNSKELVLNEMRRLDRECREEIGSADTFVTTLGTTIYYRKKNGRIVNAFFGMEMDENKGFEHLSVDEIVESLESILASLKKLRMGKPFNWIITISPQRYAWPKKWTGVDSVTQSFICKAKNMIAIQEFLKGHPSESIIYFPSFEIVIDELRLFETLSTYDHLHINRELTPKYVVKRFLKSYCTGDLINLLPLVEDMENLFTFTNSRMKAGADFNSDMIQPAWDLLLKELSKHQNVEPLLQKIDLKRKSFENSTD